MLGTVAFRAALMMGAILLVGGIAFLMFFDGDVFTASIFSFLPAAIVVWPGGPLFFCQGLRSRLRRQAPFAPHGSRPGGSFLQNAGFSATIRRQA
jgi:hypothetical protein